MPASAVKGIAPWHLLNICRPTLQQSFQQEAGLRNQNGAAAHQRYRQPAQRQAFLRNTYQAGCAFQAKGQHEDAVKSFAATVAAAPDFADAHQNLGVSLFAMERFGDAAQTCATVVRLRPNDAGSQFNLGVALLSDGKAEDAVIPLQIAARLDGGQAKHHQFLGQALVAAKRKPEAVIALMNAVRVDPADTGLLVTVAGLLIETGDLSAATGAALMAVEQQPGNVQAQAALARAFHGAGNSRAALAPARAADRLAPLNGGAAATLGAVLYALGHHAEALERCRYACRLVPKLYQAKINEALCLEALGELEAAETAARAATSLAPDDADVKHNFAAMLLASGRMTAETWELYESRLQLTAASRALADRPRWRGEDITGKTILLHCEQGFGDTLQFIRYARLVKDRGARVIVAVQPELLRLLHAWPGLDAVVSADAPLPAYDLFCPLLSLPLAFGTTLETIPSGTPYIAADAELAQAWQPAPASGLKVGLVWAGSTIFIHDSARSIPLDILAPLATVPGVSFHSLQKSAQSEAGFPMVDRMAATADFADTAAIIAGLDLVISIDSAVAHLAAAMGKEVWLLSRFVGCWRWLRNQPDNPWYPTIRVFGQPSPGDWASVAAQLRDALIQRTGNVANTMPQLLVEPAPAPRLPFATELQATMTG